MKRFPNKRVVITGAASGLGRAMALRFARDGWHVLVADMNQDGGEETVAQVELTGGESIFQLCDVRKDRDVDGLIKTAVREWGGVDVFINNAGVATHGEIDQAPMADWQWVTEINLLGVVRGCKFAVTQFKQQGYGHIVNIASMAGLLAGPNMSSYNAAKAGVVSLSETLRAELKPFDIDITLVCPAFFQTNLGATARSTDPDFEVMLQNLFSKSDIDAADIAAMVYSAVEKRQFWLLPHRMFRHMWQLKRWFPELFNALSTRWSVKYIEYQKKRGRKTATI